MYENVAHWTCVNATAYSTTPPSVATPSPSTVANTGAQSLNEGFAN